MKKCTGIIVYEKTKQGYTVYTAHAVSVSGSVTQLAIKKNMCFGSVSEVTNFMLKVLQQNNFTCSLYSLGEKVVYNILFVNRENGSIDKFLY